MNFAGARFGRGLAFAVLCSSAVAAERSAEALAPPPPPPSDEEPVQWQLAPGRYRLVGQRPDGGRTYAGTARIERVGQRLRLTRRIGGASQTIWGGVRRADPGEAWVLAFSWNAAAKPHEMVCLVDTDLDNYGRLSCHWGRAGNPHRQPGMEAYFAREPWEATRHEPP